MFTCTSFRVQNLPKRCILVKLKNVGKDMTDIRGGGEMEKLEGLFSYLLNSTSFRCLTPCKNDIEIVHVYLGWNCMLHLWIASGACRSNHLKFQKKNTYMIHSVDIRWTNVLFSTSYHLWATYSVHRDYGSTPLKKISPNPILQIFGVF